jgi:hypothetical protein
MFRWAQNSGLSSYLDDLSIKPMIHRNIKKITDAILESLNACTIYRIAWHEQYNQRKTA